MKFAAKLIAAVLSLALIVLTPGWSGYEAAAGNFKSAAIENPGAIVKINLQPPSSHVTPPKDDIGLISAALAADAIAGDKNGAVLPGINPLIDPQNLGDLLPSGFDPKTWTGTLNFHLHTHYSDGTDSPSQVVREAYAAGLRHIAITDHDTDEGIAEAEEEVRRVNAEHPDDPMELFPGIEFSAKGGAHIHLVGYDRSNVDVRTALEHNQAVRLLRAQLMLDALNERDDFKSRGIYIKMDQVKGKAKGVIAEPHIARVLVEDLHLADNLPQAFRRFLNEAKSKAEKDPRVEFVEPSRIVQVAKDSMGLASLNHPYTLTRGKDRDPDKIKHVLQTGIGGIEAGYRANPRDLSRPNARHEDRIRKYLLMAHQVVMPDGSVHGLFVLPGSDYHDPNPANGLNILNAWTPVRLAQQLLDYLRALKAAAEALKVRGVAGGGPESVSPSSRS